MSDRQNNTQPQELWWMVFSLVLGTIVLGALIPFFLIIAALGSMAIPVLALREQRISKDTHREFVEQQEQLNHVQQLLALQRGVIDATDIPIVATDAHGSIMTANERAADVLGIGEGMIGRRFDEMFTQRVLHELESLARAGEQGHARAAIPIHGEVRDFDVSADPVPYIGGAAMTFRDITELSRAVMLKADFAANASHELRTPIASIKGAAETLMGPARDDERMAGRLIEMIASNASRLELLASDLLDLSKLEADDLPVEIQELDLATTIETVFTECMPNAQRRDVRLKMQIEDPITRVHTDGSLMKLMLRNLVSNAIKFAHEGTSVRVIAEQQPVPTDRTAPPPDALSADHTGILIRVVDKGVGIPMEHQQRVFERFYQVDEARSGTAAKRGTGLGLAIVKHAARRLGGAVALESIYQSGTTVSIELPRCIEQVDAPTQESGPPHGLSGE